jgi:hypothetical protein
MWYTVIFLTSSELYNEFGRDYATGWAREPLVPIPAEANVFISLSASRQVMVPTQAPTELTPGVRALSTGVKAAGE